MTADRTGVRSLTTLVAVFFALAAASTAGAARITEFPVPTPGGRPLAIVPGPDGALWFTEIAGNKIGRITTSGAITEFTIPTPNSQPDGIALGPDGNLWFVEVIGNKVGRITPSGQITEFPVPTPNSRPTEIARGPDGNMWFTLRGAPPTGAGSAIGRITMAGAITEFPTPTPGSRPLGVTAGADGNVWFTESVGNNIGRITPAGAITEFPLPAPGSMPWEPTLGPDGNVWFTELLGNRIGRITPTGAITEFAVPTPNSQPNVIARVDDVLFFAETAGNKIGLITTRGAITEYQVPTPGSQPLGVTEGPDHAVWFTESAATANKIGRLVLEADATLAVTPSSRVIPFGSTVRYTFWLNNGGPDRALGTSLTFRAPAGTEVVSAEAAGRECEIAGANVTCDPPSIAAGGGDGMTATVVLRALKLGSLSASGILTTTSEDANTANNTATAAVRVVPASCRAGAAPSRLVAGERERILVKAVLRGAPLAGARVVASGAGTRAAATTDARGVARLRLAPTRAGTIRVSVSGNARCSTTITARARSPLAELTGRR